MIFYENKVTPDQAKWLVEFLAPIKYVPELQGQRVEDGVMSIGPWAGPEACISNVLHEIAHFVEIDEARMDKWGWGLKYPTQELFGQTFHEFSKPYHIERERRVWAYQLNLHYKYGIKEDAYHFAEAAVFLDGFGWMLPEHKGKTDEQRRKLFAHSIEKLAEDSKYSFDTFLAEYNRRKKILGGV